MKKMTKLMLTLTMLFGMVGGANATKLYATYGTPAGEGHWDAETKSYSWTASWSNLMDLFTFGAGELVNYQSLHFVTADYVDGPYRVCFMNGSTAVATIAFYSAGEKNLVFSEREETKNLDLATITSIKFGGASGAGSVKITSQPYLAKPMELVFGDDGNAEIDITDLKVSGGFSLDDQTGVLTSTGASGYVEINFPAGGVDLTALTGFSITFTGDNLFSNFEIGDGITNKGFWSNVTGRNDLNQYMTPGNVGDPTAITRWRWNNNGTASTMTISSIKLKAGVMTASNPHETLLTTAMYTGNPESHFGENMGQGATIYGMGSNIDGAQYVDLSDYDEMRIYGTPGKSVRLLFNYDQVAPVKTDVYDNLDGSGYYSLDLSTLSAQKLNAFKFPWDGASGVITKVVLYKNNIPVDYSYAISGAGAKTPSVIAALADANATCIDATGISAATLLESANPNCLFVATEGMLTNTQNVIVDGTCANLVLTDKKPFKAPVDFTATSAAFSKTVSAADYATIVLPFDAELPLGVEAYDITGNEGDVLTTSAVPSITANKPVMLKNAGTYEFTATDAAIKAVEGVQTNGLLNGVYATTDAPEEVSYVLQNKSGDVNFYKAAAGTKVDAFRAYLTTAAGARLTFDFNSETTSVSEKLRVNSEEFATAPVYNLNGQRVEKATKGLYIKNGKKVVVR